MVAKKVCPECGGDQIKPVLWGELEKDPGDAAIVAGCCIELEGVDREGKVVLGTPDLGCDECGHWWVSEKQIRGYEALARSARDRE